MSLLSRLQLIVAGHETYEGLVGRTPLCELLFFHLKTLCVTQSNLRDAS